MGRKNILTSGAPAASPTAPRPASRDTPRGAVGALQSSLSKLQESAVQDIDAALIDDAGYEDRLGVDANAQEQLKESLKAYGQQVPVLLRPHPKNTGRFEIVYGRRRLKALRELGLPVKAMVRQLDDHALVMAQGQENTSRQELSFIEKASFAAQLQEGGYDRQTIAAAISIDQPMVSRMLKVGTAFPLEFLRQIGSAPGIGRERWMTLVEALQDKGAFARVRALMGHPDFANLDSDGRFEAVLKRARDREPTRSPRKRAQALRAEDGRPLGEIRTTGKSITLTVPNSGDGFGAWLGENAQDLVRELHDRWQKRRSED